MSDAVLANGVVDAILVLVQEAQKINPAKVSRRQATGIEITFAGRRVKRISLIIVSHQPVGFAENHISALAVPRGNSKRGLQRC